MSDELGGAGAATVESPPASAPATTGSSGTPQQSADTGQESASPQVSEEPKQPTNWHEQRRSDATLNDYIQEQVKRARDADKRKALKAKAISATSATDTTEQSRAALEVARELASSQDSDETPGQHPDFVEKKNRALPAVERLTNTDEYAELWKKHGKAEMDRRFFADPEEYADWVFDQVTDLRANKRAEKRAMDLAKAMSAEQTNDALKNVPRPISAGASGSSGGMTLDRLLAMSASERITWKRQNGSQYDALVASLS